MENYTGKREKEWVKHTQLYKIKHICNHILLIKPLFLK